MSRRRILITIAVVSIAAIAAAIGALAEALDGCQP